MAVIHLRMPGTKLNLLTHCGAHQITERDLRQIKAPSGTSTWSPIPHFTLFEMIVEQLAALDLNIIQMVHAVSHEGMRYFGMVQVGLVGGGYDLVVGIRNSNDKTFPAGLALGKGVFVCDNLCFSGEVVIGRKHTIHILRDLPTLIVPAVNKLIPMQGCIADRVNHYKVTEVRGVEKILVDAMRKGIIPSSHIGKVLGEFENPRHPEFGGDLKGTVWSLEQAFTEAMKPSNPRSQAVFKASARTQDLTSLLDQVSGFSPIRALAAG